MPLKTRLNGDTFRIIASQDGTEVSIDGAVVATLNRGQIHQQLVTAESRITSNKPILVAQYSNGSSFDGVTSDPFEMLIPPTEQFGDQYTVTTPASGFRENFINLVVPDPDVGTVAIDGTAVPSGAYTAIGSSGFSGSQNDVCARDPQPDGRPAVRRVTCTASTRTIRMAIRAASRSRRSPASTR